jgi:hypothetical protein
MSELLGGSARLQLIPHRRHRDEPPGIRRVLLDLPPQAMDELLEQLLVAGAARSRVIRIPAR